MAIHGFLASLVKCVVTGTPYTVYGYLGKEIHDNIRSEPGLGVLPVLMDLARGRGLQK
jgi:hypothetical protein